QGRRQEAIDRNSRFPFPVSNIDAVILSHAHIDHSGNLPALVKNGFSGPIYTTPATVDLCAAMLADSGHLQEKDAEFLNKRLRRRRSVDPAAEGQTIEPLYTMADAQKTQPLFRPVNLGAPTEIGAGLRYRSYDAGHILGSTSMVLDLSGGQRPVRLAFSGDVGRRGLPIIRDPQPLPPVDYLIMESTYGDRQHEAIAPVKDKLAGVINRTAGRGGKIIVPAFAVGRTQQLVLLLHQLMDEKRIPAIPMFVDSPLAVNVTEVFRNHPECFDEEPNEFLSNHEDPFGFSRLRYVRDVNESKALNDLRGPFLVISASGMCEAGRVLHHLRNNIGDPRNTVLITGFQAEHTLGRKIEEKRAEVPIFGEPMALQAEVDALDALSGHADQRELLEWMTPMTPTLRKVFLVHGEEGQGRALAAAIEERHKVPVLQPARGQSVLLE
ncbi:MAG: MBL fold metallo-hydrolase RNA specificity domain-containing protein, partial [Bryobacteraceae bacterium]